MSAYAAFDPRGPLAAIVDDKFRWQARRFLNLGGARRPAQIFGTVASACKWLDAQPFILGPPLVRSSSHALARAIGAAPVVDVSRSTFPARCTTFVGRSPRT